MASKAKSIALGEHAWRFADRQVREGHFESAADVIEEGIRLLEQREQSFEALRQALADGEASGVAEGFDFDTYIDDVRRPA